MLMAMRPGWGVVGEQVCRDEEMILGASWYGYRPHTPVDRVYTA